MSNDFDVKEVVISEEEPEYTENLRVDNFKVVETPSKHSFVKPTIKIEGAPMPEHLSAAQVIEISRLVQEHTRQAMKDAKYDPNAAAQVMSQDKVPIVDYSKLSLSDVYDLSVPIVAKEFMSADQLEIKLKDSNFEARWINKNPNRLGEMIGKGFTYLSKEDLVAEDGIQTSVDAEGHYSINDVVAMKIDKATYYAALRAAHIRALSTTNASKLHERAATSAASFMCKSDVGNDYAQASNAGKMTFYAPNIGI
jgi:hypothetical protein